MRSVLFLFSLCFRSYLRVLSSSDESSSKRARTEDVAALKAKYLAKIQEAEREERLKKLAQDGDEEEVDTVYVPAKLRKAAHLQLRKKDEPKDVEPQKEQQALSLLDLAALKRKHGEDSEKNMILFLLHIHQIAQFYPPIFRTAIEEVQDLQAIEDAMIEELTDKRALMSVKELAGDIVYTESMKSRFVVEPNLFFFQKKNYF